MTRLRKATLSLDTALQTRCWETTIRNPCAVVLSKGWGWNSWGWVKVIDVFCICCGTQVFLNFFIWVSGTHLISLRLESNDRSVLEDFICSCKICTSFYVRYVSTRVLPGCSRKYSLRWFHGFTKMGFGTICDGVLVRILTFFCKLVSYQVSSTLSRCSSTVWLR